MTSGLSIEQLWAPWRLAYVKGERPAGCPFCDLPKTDPNEETLVLYSDADLFVVMNKFPYNPGHLLVIPRAHVSNPTDLSREMWNKLGSALRVCQDILMRHSSPQGFNLGMNIGVSGGAGIPAHLHWHILPRWNGDTNFMPLLAEVKAIPSHNVTVYRQLKGLFEGFAGKL